MGSKIRSSVMGLDILEELFPFVHYTRRKARKYKIVTSENILDKKQYQNYAEIKEVILEQRLYEERQRGSSMDDKTFKIILSLSVGLTILGSTSTIFVEQVSLYWAQVVFLFFIFLGLFYILVSGFIALSALKTMPSHGFGTQLFLLDSKEKQKCLAESLARAEEVNIIRHLRNEAAYQSLRNGFILIFFAALILAISLGVDTLTPGQGPEMPAVDETRRFQSKEIPAACAAEGPGPCPPACVPDSGCRR